MFDRYMTLPLILVVDVGTVAALLEPNIFLLGLVLAYARPRPPVVVDVEVSIV